VSSRIFRVLSLLSKKLESNDTMSLPEFLAINKVQLQIFSPVITQQEIMIDKSLGAKFWDPIIERRRSIGNDNIIKVFVAVYPDYVGRRISKRAAVPQSISPEERRMNIPDTAEHNVDLVMHTLVSKVEPKRVNQVSQPMHRCHTPLIRDSLDLHTTFFPYFVFLYYGQL